jgi:fatty-acyl-CoA synthase
MHPMRDDAGQVRRGRDALPYINTLVARLAARGSAPVIWHGGHEIAAADFLASIHRYARALAALGMGRGSLVALFAPNRPEALAIRYAAHLVGAAAVYLSAPEPSSRRAELIAQIDPTLLVIFAETAHLLPDGVAAPVAAIGVDLAGAALRLDVLAMVQPDDPLASLARPHDLAVIVSSGGTTGVPKGSVRDFAAYTAMVHVPSPADRRQLVNGRLAYLSQALVDMTLLGGGCVVLRDAYDPADTLATIEAERITHLFLVEPQLFEVMDHPDVARRDLTSLRALTHIGASAPTALRLRAWERLGPVLAHTYGASEMGLVSALSPAEHALHHPEVFACAGRVLPQVEIRFRRTDGALAGAGEAGSIEVRSPAMASGYRNRPEQQAVAFQDGWYRTGDFGFLDPPGFLHILDRAADIAWIDGVMVSPALLQDTLCRLPTIRYAVVVAGEQPDTWIAAVVPWCGTLADAAQCRNAIQAAYGVAAGPLTVVSCQRIPLTEQGKPDRAAIRRLGMAAGRVR